MRKNRLTKITAMEAMKKEVTLVSPDTTIEELNEQMILKKQQEVVVVNSDDEVIGIITKNDLAKNLARGVEKNVPIKYIMSTNVICMESDQDLLQSRDEMRKVGIGRAPVIDKNHHILGLLTVQSICDGFSKRLEDVANYLNDILNNMDECVLVIDKEGKVMYVNERAEIEFSLKGFHHFSIDHIFTKEIVDKILKLKGNIHNMKLSMNNKEFLINTAYFQDVDRPLEIIITIRDITDIEMINQELNKTHVQLKYLQEKVDRLATDSAYLGNISTLNKRMKEVLEVAQRVSKTQATVFITGESGTGKEVLARAIFEDSQRRNKSFIAINCGAIPHNLLESELFGYEQGAFTGANKYGKSGIFELAHGGTIFLDEIGELPMDMQVKLLRVLEEQVFYRVGGTAPIQVDVRIIAATNRDLENMIKENKFREDLYYRINVIKLEIPALRDRKEDIPNLINVFVEGFCKRHRKRVEKIDKDVLKILLDYHWPGNIRELKNVIERIVILSQNEEIVVDDLPPYILKGIKNEIQGSSVYEKVDLERDQIIELMKKYRGNKSKVAKSMNIPRSTLYYKLKLFNIKI